MFCSGNSGFVGVQLTVFTLKNWLCAPFKIGFMINKFSVELGF